MNKGYMLIGLLLSLVLLPSTLAYPEYESAGHVTNETEAFDTIHNYTDNYAIFPLVYGASGLYANLTWNDYVGLNTSYSFNISTSALFDSNWYNFIQLEGWNGTEWVNVTQIDCNGTTITNQTINVTSAQTYTNASGHIQLRFQWYCDQIGGDTCDSADGRIYEVFTVPPSQPPAQPSTSSLLVTMIITIISIIIAISLLLAVISLSDTTKGVDLSSLITTAVIAFIGTIIITLLLSFA